MPERQPKMTLPKDDSFFPPARIRHLFVFSPLSLMVLLGLTLALPPNVSRTLADVAVAEPGVPRLDRSHA